MKVFISWSGEESRAVANALGEWIPNVIQQAEPWVSTTMAKGSHWPSELRDHLASSTFGIVCLTPSNVAAPWLNWEAGAIANQLNASRVCPYLFKMDKASVGPPIGHLQMSLADRPDTLLMLRSLNSALGEGALRPEKLSTIFEKWWPDLELQLKNVPEGLPPGDLREDREILEEILAAVRSMTVTKVQVSRRDSPKLSFRDRLDRLNGTQQSIFPPTEELMLDLIERLRTATTHKEAEPVRFPFEEYLPDPESPHD